MEVADDCPRVIFGVNLDFSIFPYTVARTCMSENLNGSLQEVLVWV